MNRYVVVDFARKKVNGKLFDEYLETKIEAKDRNEAGELLQMTDSPKAYILDKASGKRIIKA